MKTKRWNFGGVAYKVINDETIEQQRDVDGKALYEGNFAQIYGAYRQQQQSASVFGCVVRPHNPYSVCEKCKGTSIAEKDLNNGVLKVCENCWWQWLEENK